MKIRVLIILLFDKIFGKTMFELLFVWYVKKFRKFYTHIDYLPLFNFAEIMKENLNYMYEININRKVPKIYFLHLIKEMNYQFRVLDNENARDKATLAEYDYNMVIAKDKRTKNRWLNEYNTLKAKIDKKKTTPFDLTGFLNYIETTFNHAPGSINPKEISTSRAFLSYQQAIKHNKNKT